MKRIASTLLGALMLCSLAYASVNQQQFTVHFASDSASLDEAAVAELEKVLAYTKTGNYFELMLGAHTDHDGTNNYNVELSKNRAMSVRNYLMSQGLEDKWMEFDWFGEKKPVETNVTDKGKQANRRVTIDVKLYAWDSATDILDDLSAPKQEFTINPEKQTTLSGREGVKIEIPKNAFVTPDGKPVEGAVTISLEEALSRESWLTEGLSTISPQGILESGGMFKVAAMQGDVQLTLKEGTEMNVQVPFVRASNDMGLFYANTDSTGNMLWERSETPVQNKPSVELPVLKLDIVRLDEMIAKYTNTKVPYPFLDSAIFKLQPGPKFTLSPPRKPKEPKRSDIRVDASATKKLFMTKKQEEQIIEEKYQKKMEVYNKNLAFYNRRLDTYNKAKAKYEKELEDFNAKQPEHRRIIEAAIKTMNETKAAYQQNMANESVLRCLMTLKEKMLKGQITDPNFISSLTSWYKYDWFHYSSSTYYTSFPQQLSDMRNKLEELGYPEYHIYSDNNWRMDSQFTATWGNDKELYTFLNDAREKLVAERFAKGLGTYVEMSGYYTTALNTVGNWINIDRFMKQELNASLNIKQEPGSLVYVIFDEINSVLPGYNGLRVPANKSMTIFSIALINNQPHYAVERVTSKAKVPTTVDLKYQQGLLSDIKAAIKRAV